MTTETKKLNRLTAHLVLDDALTAIQRLEERSEISPRDNWRIDYVAAVVLLRAVGHVLNKVDGKDTELKKMIDALWPEIRATEAFRWIESTRNAVLKIYSLQVEQMIGWEWVGEHSGPGIPSDAVETGSLFLTDTSIFAPDRLREIYFWWSDVLAAIIHNRPLHNSGKLGSA